MEDTLDKEIEAFEKMKSELIQHHLGKFVIIHNQILAGSFDSFDNAAEEAYSKFGRGPYLIRQVGAEPLKMPASVAYRKMNAPN